MKQIDADMEAELERELSSGPLPRKGFTDQLRMRIEERVDEKEKSSRSWFAMAGYVCSIIVMLAVFTSVVLYSDKTAEIAIPNTVEIQQPQQQELSMFSAGYDSQESFKSGLLIGLRNDDRDVTYRTLYIAPKNDRPAVVAQGSGILVPYKRDFWKIDQLRYETVTDRFEFFAARPASQRAAEPRSIAPTLFRDNPNEKVVHAERILFAGNEYVSIGETNETIAGNVSSPSSKMWTTTIPSLAGKREPVSLSEVLQVNTTAPDYTTHEWFVARSQGRWVPMTAEQAAESASAKPALLETYRQINAQLPKTVVNHDEPCCAWSELGTRFPGASDSFSSPAKDMTVVSSDGLLLVFGSPDQLSGEPALTIKLKPKETVVMAQWATDHYVEEWAVKTSQLLR
ncbi:hypothetical protein [Paenibacillus sp. GCM10012303]|jgi:hypothetical protein|uniref:hypothetical protein n=1 Tax=Paenibacillus sp. GCM10012303 TaxID=3317340 RepID=UPI003607B444